jgi:hypothetical protein
MSNIIYRYVIIGLMICFFPLANSYASTLVGAWKLTSFEMHSSHKQSPPCYSPSGLLTYTATGYVSVGFNCMKTNDSKQPSFKLDDMTFYTGKYVVKGNNVIHITQNGSGPDYYDKKLLRKIDLLTDNELVLSLKQEGNLIVLKWDRVG